VEDLPPLEDGERRRPPDVAAPEDEAPAAPASGDPRAPSAERGARRVAPEPRPDALGPAAFEELMVIDPEGRVVASTHEGHEGHSAANLGYFQQGLGATYLEPVFASPITGRLTMVVSTPVRDPSTRRRRRAGGAAQPRAASSAWSTTTPASAPAARRWWSRRSTRRRLSFMAPTRHDPGGGVAPAGGWRRARRRGGARRRRPAATSGTGEHVDYRGVEVLAAWEPIPSLEWGLVVKIDRARRCARCARPRCAWSSCCCW
jgi:hypothetical protein